jgi:hypothetical protein
MMEEEIDAEAPKKKTKSPFKDKEDLKKEIRDFVNQYKASIVSQADRMSDFFEMSCFNYIVRYYELNDYTVSVDGLQKGQYRYKCSTMGIQSNFSFFKVTKQMADISYAFEIHHNLAVQSWHHEKIFTTPDITIVKAGGIEFSKDHYETKMTFSYAGQSNLISFCEVKQFNPYPELLFNFIGTVNELCPSVISNNATEHLPVHIAPSLMISGVPNRHTKNIKESLEGRYCINIIFNMFHTATQTFSKARIKELSTTGVVARPKEKADKRDEQDYFKVLLGVDEPPF